MKCFVRKHARIQCAVIPFVGCWYNWHGKNWFGTKGFSLVQKRSVLLTETPPQPNLLFPAGAALKYIPPPPPPPLLLFSSPLLFISLCSSSLSLCRRLHLRPAIPPCSLSRVLSASDSSIHEKCDVSRSSATRWRCRPPTHSPGAAGVRGMPVILQPLSPSLPAFVCCFSPSWPSVQSFSPGFFPPPIPASELREVHESELCLLWVICWCCVFAVHLSGSSVMWRYFSCLYIYLWCFLWLCMCVYVCKETASVRMCVLCLYVDQLSVFVQ